MDKQEVDQHAPHQAPHRVASITKLRAHPLRMLVVFGTPIAFATTGFLHLVPWPSGSEVDIYTRLRDHATLWIAIHIVQLPLILLLAVAVSWLTEGLTSTAARVSRVALLPLPGLLPRLRLDRRTEPRAGGALRQPAAVRAAGRAAGGDRRPRIQLESPVLTSCALHDLPHRLPVLGGCCRRRGGRPAPGGGAVDGDDPLGPGRGHRRRRSRPALRTDRDGPVPGRRRRAQPPAGACGPPTGVCVT